MPVFNGIATIERALSSCKELLKFNDIDLTLFIIDDNSDDGTTELINDLISPDFPVNFICNNTNIGPGLARNLALDKVNEGFVGFLDADDEIIPDNYYKAFKEGFLNGADWITFNGLTEKNNVLSEKYDFHRIKDNTNMLIRKCLRSELDSSVIFSIYSTDLIERMNLRFTEGFYEDITFAYTAMVSAKNRHISNHMSYLKHNTEGSILNSISEKHIDGLLRTCVTVKNNFQKLNKSYLNYLESDFIYGAQGYLAILIMKILKKNNNGIKIKLLQHLIKVKETIYELNQLPLKKDTKKELLSSYFLENYKIYEQKDLLHNLNNLNEELFGKKYETKEI